MFRCERNSNIEGLVTSLHSCKRLIGQTRPYQLKSKNLQKLWDNVFSQVIFDFNIYKYKLGILQEPYQSLSNVSALTSSVLVILTALIIQKRFVVLPSTIEPTVPA